MSDHRKTLIAALIGLLLWFSFSSNPPQGRTGGPGEATCATAGCHFPINAIINGSVHINGIPDDLVPDDTYRLQLDLVIESGAPVRGGFQMMALSLEEEPVNGFSNADESSTISMSNDRFYFEHNPAKNFGASDTVRYEVDWKVPIDFDSEKIVFYAAANFANGGGSGGDRIITLQDTFNVMSSSNLTISTSILAPQCPEGDDGKIEISVSGGTAPYQFLWETGDTTSSLEFIEAGVYAVTVTDASDLEEIVSIVLPDGVDDIAPTLRCVSDTLNINNCAPFSYPTPSGEDNCSPINIIRIEGRGPGSSFDAGIHDEIYEGSDASGNISRCTITIKNSIELESGIQVNDIACFGDSLGSITISPSGTNAPFEFQIDPIANIDELATGTYMITIIDNSGCALSEVVEITIPDSLLFESIVVAHPRTTSSGDGSIDVTVRGGTPPYSFNWRTEDEDFSSEEDLELLFPGEYILEVTDDNGCNILSDTILLDAITSIVDVDLSESVHVYPNPFQELIDINLNGLKGKGYWIYRMTGELVKFNHTIPSRIDFSRFPSGPYYLLILLEDGKYVGRKVLKN